MILLSSKNRLHRLIKKRRSPVSFSSQNIKKEEMALLFEAARWAPSSNNQQPWRFIYAGKQDEEAYGKLFDLLADGNKEWAKSAPVLILGVAEKISSYKNRPNRFAFYDLGMAVGNLLFQATSMGIYVHQMGGYDVEKAIKVFSIPEKYEPAAMMAIGYKGEVDSLPMELKRRELAKRKRNEASLFAFRNEWKETKNED
jgi:nitroreductase